MGRVTCHVNNTCFLLCTCVCSVVYVRYLSHTCCSGRAVGKEGKRRVEKNKNPPPPPKKTKSRGRAGPGSPGSVSTRHRPIPAHHDTIFISPSARTLNPFFPEESDLGVTVCCLVLVCWFRPAHFARPHFYFYFILVWFFFCWSLPRDRLPTAAVQHSTQHAHAAGLDYPSIPSSSSHLMLCHSISPHHHGM